MRKLDKSLWFALVDRLADSVLEETVEELSSDLPPGQSMADAAEKFRNQLLEAFDGKKGENRMKDVEFRDCLSALAFNELADEQIARIERLIYESPSEKAEIIPVYDTMPHEQLSDATEAGCD